MKFIALNKEIVDAEEKNEFGILNSLEDDEVYLIDTEYNNNKFDDVLCKSPIDISKKSTFPNERSLRSDSLLPKSASQARKYIDNLHIPNSSYKRIKDGIEHRVYSEYYMDLDTYGHSSSHPIYLSLANIPMQRRTKYESKAFIGYLPIIQANSESQKKSDKFRLLKQQTFQNCLNALFEPLIFQYKTSYCLTSKSPKSKHPCPKCLVNNHNLSSIFLNKKEMQSRTHKNMEKALLNDQCQDYSLVKLPNIFWSHSFIDIYAAVMPDRMHHYEMDNRYKIIARFPGLKLWKKGIGTIAKFTAADYRQLMQITIFAIDALLENESDVKREWAKEFISLFKTLSDQTLDFASFQNAFKTFYLVDHSILLQEAKELNCNSERILGLGRLPQGINSYFEIFENISITEFEKENINIILFESLKLPNGNIVRASDSFYNAPFYSDIRIQMSDEEASDYETDNEKCYGKISLLLQIVIKESNVYNLAFVNWYDFKYNQQNLKYKFNYPYLKRTDDFALIPIEAIDGIVHIVKRYCKENAYFVNYHLFE
ncbi:hypothetical protein C1646_755712 [Rhizophagus diaphanus]|nr:hypothetical protein C1646_755712 [Rhizophagus diaphanus] [Rhizophagus sp. MUCL 43196]